MKEWLVNHAELIVALSVVIGGFWNLNSKMWDLSEKISSSSKETNEKITEIDKRLIVIETYMIMQGAPIRALAKDLNADPAVIE